MRIDKFLKVSRLIKRRTLAHDVCEAGRVRINGKVAKPATEVSVGDALEVRLPTGTVVTVTVAEIRENVSAKDAARLYQPRTPT